MGRWAEAFQASIQRHDTADTVDTPSRETAAAGQSVISVSSVMPKEDAEHIDRVLPSDLVSAVSRRSTTDIPPVGLAPLYSASLDPQRPVSWADTADMPVPGCFCSCCRSRRWWTDTRNSRGWCCWTCHPPDHLSADAITEVTT
jgi:hypothetical protein